MYHFNSKNENSETFPIEQHKKGLIIGKGGCVIKNIIKTSNCNIEVNNDHLVITGSKDNILIAKNMIIDILGIHIEKKDKHPKFIETNNSYSQFASNIKKTQTKIKKTKLLPVKYKSDLQTKLDFTFIEMNNDEYEKAIELLTLEPDVLENLLTSEESIRGSVLVLIMIKQHLNLKKYLSLFGYLFNDNEIEQLNLLFYIHKYCNELGFPKITDSNEYLITHTFKQLFELDIIHYSVFIKWSEIDPDLIKIPNMLKAIIQTSEFIIYIKSLDFQLETSSEEVDEELQNRNHIKEPVNDNDKVF
jgi:hypothetical protein